MRTLNPDGSFTEKSTRLHSKQFYLTALGSKGVPDIEGVVWVDYVSNATNADSGGIYLFQQEGELFQVARVAQKSEQGSKYSWEELIFPEDQYGMAGIIRYKKEIGYCLNEKANWKKRSVETKDLVWDKSGLSLAQQLK